MFDAYCNLVNMEKKFMVKISESKINQIMLKHSIACKLAKVCVFFSEALRVQSNYV